MIPRLILDKMGGSPLASSLSQLSKSYATCPKRRVLAWDMWVFSNAKENPPSKFMGFSIGINLDWNNIHIKAIKGVYNDQNSKFGVFNNGVS